MVDVFDVQIYFIVLREALEAIIVVSILLAFLKQGLGGATEDPVVYKKLVRQVWWGSILGVITCLAIGGGFIGAFYTLGKDIWGKSEELWEGIFSIIATVMISLMGIAMLRINKMKEKWRVKLARALISPPQNKKDRFKIGYLTKKYCMFILPYITCLREGLEAVVFVGGVGLTSPATSFPVPVITGLITGILIGIFLYFGGSRSSLQVFLILSTCILYLMSAGLFSKAVWDFEAQEFNVKTGGDAEESGEGPGSYNALKSVWHVNCCNPELESGWDVFNAILGWQNSATYGSVISYNVYWIVIMVFLYLLSFEEKHGHLPFTKNFTIVQLNPMYHIKNKKKDELTQEEKDELFAKMKTDNIFAVEHKNATAAAGNLVASNSESEDVDSSKKETIIVEETKQSSF